MRRQVLLLLLVPVLVAGCGAGETRSTSGASRPQVTVVAAGLPAVQRSVIRSASIAVTVADPATAADRAGALATSAGGLVQDDRRTRADHGRADLVLRVPNAKVGEVLTSLAHLGREVDRQVADKDVTEEAVDLKSRIATQRASVARIRALLAQATSLSDITGIEGQLTKREADLESLENRSTALHDQIDLATVAVTLVGSGTPLGSHLGFLDGLDGGWQALGVVARLAAVTAGALLPFTPMLLIPFLGRLLWLRRRGAPTT